MIDLTTCYLAILVTLSKGRCIIILVINIGALALTKLSAVSR